MSEIIALVPILVAAVRQAIKAQEKLLDSRAALDVKKTLLDVDVSYRKFQVWRGTWYGEGAQKAEVTAVALWGREGWANVRRILERIVRANKDLEAFLAQFRENQKTRSRWKTAIKSMRSKRRPQPELQRLVAEFGNAVDELWIYSETVFDSLHGIMAQGLRPPSREMMLTSAVQSRAGSLELYGLCAKSTLDCSLAMDLLDSGSDLLSPLGPSNPLRTPGGPSMPLYYQLFTQAIDSPIELQKVTIEHVQEVDLLKTERGQVVQADSSGLQLFEPKTETTIIQVQKQGSCSASCLRIPKRPPTKVLLKSSPEKLATVLSAMRVTTNISATEHFSVGAKIELAYKIVESGFFLLGTPWFSSLSSRSLLRLKSAGGQRHSFTLEIQTLDFSDLLYDDPEALAETSQLYRMGVLLMEIALDRTNLLPEGEGHGHEMDMVRLLPKVEQTMGVQYCKATAFCLQYQHPTSSLQGSEKYSGPHFIEWESYLSGFLQNYYLQVFLRLEELRNVDNRSEYRSRVSSWRTKSL